MKDKFENFSTKCADITGSPLTFAIAVAMVIGWACIGPFVGFSDTWQLYINTLTTISTGLLVFIIQASQNRVQRTQDNDTKAIQEKLNELIRVNEKAHDNLIGIERREDDSSGCESR